MPGPFDRSILDALTGSLVDTVKGAAYSAIPECNCCDQKAVPIPCVACGEYSCIDHGFFNKRLQAICGQCAMALEVDLDEDEPQVADVDAERIDWAFSILGLSKSATSDEIKAAHRKLAMQYHPDRGGNETDFSQAQKAFEVASEYAKQEGR